MVRIGLAVSSLAFSASLFAQSPAVPVPGSAVPAGVQPGGIPVAGGAPQTAADPKLVAHLVAWEKRMKEIENVVCDIDKTEKDNVLKREMKKVGKIYVMKPNLAWMRLDRAPSMPPDATDFETWISDGKSIYQYEGRVKKMTEFQLAGNGGLQGNLLFEFMSGSMTAQAALKRFDMSLLGEDANYVHMQIKPININDKSEFEVMTISFVSPAIAASFQHLRYLPAAVSMSRNNNKESEIWQFTRNAQVNVKEIQPAMFRKQPIPPDWKSSVAGAVSTQTQPRTARP